MPKSCSAKGCTVRFIKGANLKFHKYPKNEDLRKKWVEAVNRENFQPSEAAKLCSKHFQPDDYYINVHGNKCLKKEAIPSVFPDRPWKKNDAAANNKEGSEFKLKRESDKKSNTVKPINGITSENEPAKVPYPAHHVTKEGGIVANKCVCLKKSSSFENNASNSVDENLKRINSNLGLYSGLEKKIGTGSRTINDTTIHLNDLEDENYYWLQIPKVKVPEVRKLGYQFGKLVEEVKYMKLPNSEWRIIIIVQNQKMVSVSFLKKPYPEKVVTINGKSSVCDIIIDRKNIVLLGSPVYIYSIEDLEIMLDIVNELEPNDPIVGYIDS
ncbi:uncharacterized protein LOC123311602 [Coccinella septempunctata]|uniref:uncharacterized protein LOC123311602 n=1 Tax=Coccinella septempunctata TaxID=41139 RepID=UPI001D07F32E|nr:uncharacterized protein LOC123311602 [Coccinella septempunctata]